MPASNFINNTTQSKFTGIFNYQGFNYDYTIYLKPFSLTDKNEIIRYFGNRIYKGKTCLDINEKDIRTILRKNDASAFFIVRVDGIDNVASGSLQIYDWCETTKREDVWINDVCKISPMDVILQEKTNPGSTGVPVDVMFILMEQLVAQNLGKNHIKLFVENEPSNANFLVPRYQKMGFQIDSVCSQKFPDDITMEKQINLDTNIIDFTFLVNQQLTTTGGRYKRKKTHKKKIRKNKTQRRKYRKNK